MRVPSMTPTRLLDGSRYWTHKTRPLVGTWSALDGIGRGCFLPRLEETSQKLTHSINGSQDEGAIFAEVDP